VRGRIAGFGESKGTSKSTGPDCKPQTVDGYFRFDTATVLIDSPILRVLQEGRGTANLRRPRDRPEHRVTTIKLRSEGLTWQEIDGELVILDLKNSVYLTTNAAGAVITKLLTEERTVDQLSEALVDEFGIEKDLARRDIEAFVKQLKEKRLLD
jgi:hypothetical protein